MIPTAPGGRRLESKGQHAPRLQRIQQGIHMAAGRSVAANTAANRTTLLCVVICAFPKPCNRALHESGHLLFDGLFGAHPGVNLRLVGLVLRLEVNEPHKVTLAPGGEAAGTAPNQAR